MVMKKKAKKKSQKTIRALLRLMKKTGFSLNLWLKPARRGDCD